MCSTSKSMANFQCKSSNWALIFLGQASGIESDLQMKKYIQYKKKSLIFYIKFMIFLFLNALNTFYISYIGILGHNQKVLDVLF